MIEHRKPMRCAVVLGCILVATSCDPAVKPVPPTTQCSQLAAGKIVHLYEVEDWREDGLGDRDLG